MFQFKHRYFFLLLFISLSQLVFSEGILILDKEKSVDMALENNLNFKNSAIILETLRREESNAWSNLLPVTSLTLGLEGSDSLFSSSSPSNPSPWKTSSKLQMNLNLNSSLVWTINQTKLDYQAQLISYEQAQMELIVNVEKEFYYLLTSESDLGIEKSNMELTQRIYEQEVINYENGFASELDVLQSQVNAAMEGPSYSQAVADHQKRLRDFLNILGIDPLMEVQLTGALDVTVLNFEAQNLIKKYLTNRTDIRAQEKMIESLKNSRKINSASTRTPTLGFSASWNTGLYGPFSSDSWTDDSNFSDSLSFGIDLKIPLDGFVPGSRDNLTLQNLDDQIASAEITLTNLMTSARLEIINLTEQLKTSEANLKLARLNIELAQKSYSVSEDSYSRGAVERLDVEDAQQSLLEANQSFLTHQYNYMVSLIDLRNALNLDSIEELKEIDNEN